MVTLKQKKKDGYEPVKVGFQDIEERKVSKQVKGVFKKASVPLKKYLREFRDLAASKKLAK